jgi:hypothetical protein
MGGWPPGIFRHDGEFMPSGLLVASAPQSVFGKHDVSMLLPESRDRPIDLAQIKANSVKGLLKI